MQNLKTISFLLIAVFFFLPLSTIAQSNYVKTYCPIADSLSKVYEIPSALFLGIAIIESGAGKSRNAKLLKNHFGIVGRNKLLKSHGKKSRYKQYTNVSMSYIDFAKHLTKRKFYTLLKGNMNYQPWVDAMSKDNYSEMPKIWKQRVLSAIKHNRLTCPQ